MVDSQSVLFGGLQVHVHIPLRIDHDRFSF
jgi:hypothetical protein